MSMTLIEKAQKLAHEAHDSIGQKRKYRGEPYWVHTDEVAAIVASVGGTEEMICAAHLHDVLEDVTPKNPKYDIAFLAQEFNFRVSGLVGWLTDEYTKEAYPQYNRASRKSLERRRLEGAPNDAKTIKLADLISNTQSIVADDPDFAHTYLREKWELLPILEGGSPELMTRAREQTINGAAKIGIDLS